MYEHDIETCLHDHNHEGHTSDEEQAFPPYEENLFISLAKQARAGLLETPPDVSVEEIEELARRYRIDDILERLGEREPPLKFGHYASTVLAFASGYHQLPPPPTRYEHDEHHHDVHNDSHDCGKIHGPVRRWLDRLESEMLSRIPNRRVQAMAAIALRLCSLSICPGDDIAAVGMQVYSAASGSSHEGERPEGKEEEKAVLPRRPRIDFEANKAYLPLDVVVSHEELPNTKFGDELRDITNDNGPKQNDATTERLKKEAALKPEKLRRRQRIMAFGAIALTALGVVLGGSVQSTKTDTAPARNNTAPVPQPDIRPDHQNILNRPVIM
ncbi:MAG TPA: hypothetical protein VNX65_04505, partial [Patescibacteria group bacterium]|nr:hypothetical protein [Patescibacteria group bacterium]